jgi:hypothetical protein
LINTIAPVDVYFSKPLISPLATVDCHHTACTVLLHEQPKTKHDAVQTTTVIFNSFTTVISNFLILLQPLFQPSKKKHWSISVRNGYRRLAQRLHNVTDQRLILNVHTFRSSKHYSLLPVGEVQKTLGSAGCFLPFVDDDGIHIGLLASSRKMASGTTCTTFPRVVTHTVRYFPLSSCKQIRGEPRPNTRL